MNKKIKIILCITVILILSFLLIPKIYDFTQKEISEENNHCIFSINNSKLINGENYIIGNINEPPTISIENCKEKINNLIVDGEKIDIEKKNQNSFKLPFLILPQKYNIQINNNDFSFYYLLKENFSLPLIDKFNNDWLIPESTNNNSWKIENNTLFFINNNQYSYSSLASRYKITRNFIIEFSLTINSIYSKPTIYLLNNEDTIFFYNDKIGIKDNNTGDKYTQFYFKTDTKYRIKIIRNETGYNIFAEEILTDHELMYNFSTPAIFKYETSEIKENDYWGIGSWSNYEFEITNLIFGEY